MTRRPAHLDLGKDHQDAFDPPKLSFRHQDMPSPRTGDVPPALSPLDAFAMHSRMLARKFEEEREQGRRISRLPPVVVAKEIANRPGYFRNLSTGSDAPPSELPDVREENSPVSAGPVANAVVAPDENSRPKSQYPVLSGTQGSPIIPPDLPGAVPWFPPHGHQPSQSSTTGDYFGVSAPRASSPEPVDNRPVNVEAPSPTVPSLTSSVDTMASHPRAMTNESQRSQRSQPSERGLAPPQSPRYPRSPRSFQSIRSVPADSGDEDAFSTNGSQAVGSSRKFSNSSMSRPQSPFSPWMHQAHRSPSLYSEHSIASSQPPPRPTANFSRPMSSSGRRSTDARQSMDSRTSLDLRQSMDLPLRHHRSNLSQTVTSPLSTSFSGVDQLQPAELSTSPYATSASTPQLPEVADEDVFNENIIANGKQQPASYIYAKYALPRGRALERTSAGTIRDSWIQRQFNWDKPLEETVKDTAQVKKSLANLDVAARAPSPMDGVRSGRDMVSASSAIRSRSADPRAQDASSASSEAASSSSAAIPGHRSTTSISTESTSRTIRQPSLHQKSASADLTAEDHLEIGIQAHSAGETTKSTYHLRLAAISGVPTAMLLYALACRHGWGMRPNPEEGVRWLRKAIETTGLDVVDAENKLNTAARTSRNDPVAEARERRERKAQYALAMYELGISSMKGWGCPKDKPLALRCFEIAGSWGDADALAEAGYCYTQGIGCKKDLHRAAALYRQAEASGMSMAGNSWIYKAKYMTDDTTKRPETARSIRGRTGGPDDRPGTSATTNSTATFATTATNATTGRARSRSFFGRKKEKPGAGGGFDSEKIPVPVPVPQPAQPRLSGS